MPTAGSSSSARLSWTPFGIGLATGSALLITLVAFEELAATTIIPVVAEPFDVVAWYSIASGAALATRLSAIVVADALADWRGSRFILFAGLVFFATGLVVCAAGTNVAAFVISRVFQGFNEGLLIASLYVLVGAVASPHHRPSSFASFSLAQVLLSLVGPAIAGHMTQEWGQHYVFSVVPLFIAIAAFPVAYVLRLVPAAQGQRSPVLASLSRDAGLVGIGVMLPQLAGALSSPFTQFAVFALGACIAAWALPRLLPRGMFVSRRGMPSAILARLSALASQVGFAVMIPLILQRVHGWSEASSVRWVTLGSITWSIGAVGQVRAHDAHPRRRLPVISGTLMAIGAIPIGALLFPSIPVWVALIGWLPVGLGVGLVHALLSVVALEVTPETKRGRVASWLQVADSAGPVLGLVLVSVAMSVWAATATVGGAAYTPYWVTAAVLVILTVVVVMRPRPSSKRITGGIAGAQPS